MGRRFQWRRDAEVAIQEPSFAIDYPDRCTIGLSPLGDHALRGVSQRQPAFGLPEEG